MLDVERVSVRLGGKRVVSEASLHVGEGRIVGLLGPNGCGKSTLLRSVFRVLRPETGRITLRGEDVWHHSARWVGQRIGVVLQHGPLEFPLTVFEVVMLGRVAKKALVEPDHDIDRELVAAAIATLGLTDLAHRSFQELSGGERQRVAIAQALVSQPQLLVMDEPLNHLDLHHQHDLMRILRGLGTSTLIAMHDLNMAARYCDEVCLMKQGRIRTVGTPDEVLEPESVESIYGIRVLRLRHPVDGTPVVVAV